jgi:caa(3)-type oxidase subunit IV
MSDPNEHTHIDSVGTYVKILVALLVATGLTSWVANIDLGPVSTVVALGIATAKMTLVALYFMHIRHSTKLKGPVAWPGVAGDPVAHHEISPPAAFSASRESNVGQALSPANRPVPIRRYCSLVAALAALIFSTSASCDFTLGTSSAVGANFSYAFKRSAAPA